MPRSMTGFGIGKASAASHAVNVELRSVNNRFLDLVLKMPRALNQYEQELREILKSKLDRGRVVMQVNEEWEKDYAPSINIDTGKARNYAEALEKLRQTLGIGGAVELEHIINIGDIFSSGEDESYRAELFELTKNAVIQALAKLLEVSQQEGKNLADDLSMRMEQIESERKLIQKLADEQVELFRERLMQRFDELLNDNRLDKTRLETEIALAADKLDISEEIVRLGSHLELFNNKLSENKPVGKTLNFILQEMGREANTMASKSWLVEISQAAIRIKEILEQVREQVQNIE